MIVIHCSASPHGVSLFRGHLGEPGVTTSVEQIDSWQAKRGWHRKPEWRKVQNPRLEVIGHLVIYVDGTVASGRAWGEVGAHVLGQHLHSIGICRIGTGRFTRAQWKSLAKMIDGLQRKCRAAPTVGHRNLSPDEDGGWGHRAQGGRKDGLGFDVAAWLAGGMGPVS